MVAHEVDTVDLIAVRLGLGVEDPHQVSGLHGWWNEGWVANVNLQ